MSAYSRIFAQLNCQIYGSRPDHGVPLTSDLLDLAGQRRSDANCALAHLSYSILNIRRSFVLLSCVSWDSKAYFDPFQAILGKVARIAAHSCSMWCTHTLQGSRIREISH